MSMTILFWLLFGLLNAFYFIPRYLLEIFHTQFFPIKGLITGPPTDRLRYLFVRKNYDIFRISVDLFVLVISYPLFLHESIAVWPYFIAVCIYFWISLLYQIYYHAFHRIYHLDPVFFHDYLMLKTALQIFVHEYTLKNLLITIVGALIGIGGGALLYHLIALSGDVSFGFGSFVAIGLICMSSLYSVAHYAYSKYPMLTFQCQLQSFVRNVIMSIRSRKSLASLTLKYMKNFNVDTSIRLDKKPNLYFIVIESYGKVALQDPELRAQFDRYVPALQKRLDGHGWHTSSGYTISPVTGGASWISYTSMQYGLNVRNQGVYLTMLKNKYMQEYDSLFHWLKRQGYITFRLSSLGGYEKMEIPYDSYSRLYGIDHWIKYNDLDFTGEHYGFGPSPPDQYALWKGEEISREMAGDQSKALFFISQNSHTPYDSPLEIAEDWKSLNADVKDEKKASMFWSRPKFEKYGAAIEYQLEFLIDFIVRQGKEEDIFVLVGDHQPPSLSITMDGFETPLHVICKDPAFAACWSEYGLVPGLIPNVESVSLRQESIHSALLRSLIKTYASENTTLPTFLPNGIPYP